MRWELRLLLGEQDISVRQTRTTHKRKRADFMSTHVQVVRRRERAALVLTLSRARSDREGIKAAG